jgi:hypothetical protein
MKFRIEPCADELIIQQSENDNSWEYVCSIRFGNVSKENRIEETWRRAIKLLDAYRAHYNDA